MAPRGSTCASLAAFPHVLFSFFMFASPVAQVRTKYTHTQGTTERERGRVIFECRQWKQTRRQRVRRPAPLSPTPLVVSVGPHPHAGTRNSQILKKNKMRDCHSGEKSKRAEERRHHGEFIQCKRKTKHGGRARRFSPLSLSLFVARQGPCHTKHTLDQRRRDSRPRRTRTKGKAE